MKRLAWVGGAGRLGATLALAQPAGETVYATQKCRMCHSIAGNGNPKGPLDGVAKRGAAAIREWIVDAPTMALKTGATRKPPMKAFALSKDDLDALVAYLMTLR